MKNTERREIWGILGGMGPLASAEFVHTIYQETISGTDQNSPTVILLSNPAVLACFFTKKRIDCSERR